MMQELRSAAFSLGLQGRRTKFAARSYSGNS